MSERVYIVLVFAAFCLGLYAYYRERAKKLRRQAGSGLKDEDSRGWDGDPKRPKDVLSFWVSYGLFKRTEMRFTEEGLVVTTDVMMPESVREELEASVAFWGGPTKILYRVSP
jgi:hypothetical protein